VKVPGSRLVLERAREEARPGLPMRTVCIDMDDTIDLATLAGGLKGDDQQKVTAGIAIAAVPGMACLGNAAPLSLRGKLRSGEASMLMRLIAAADARTKV
jgi:hypothetical protein